jgi:hypothetical protein
LNGYGPTLTIDRKNPEGNYCPGNCRWVDRKTQSRNKSNNRYILAWGERKLIPEWMEDPRWGGAGRRLISERIMEMGWPPEQAISRGRVAAKDKRTAVYITYEGKTLNVSEWADATGINRNTIKARLRQGWGIREALTTPVRKRGH